MLEFIRDFSHEQRRALHETIRTLEDFSDEHFGIPTSKYAITRYERLTLTVDNFFNTYSDDNFRGLDYFCEYTSSLHYEELEVLKQLFGFMSNNLFFEIAVNSSRTKFEIFLYFRGDNEPELFELKYSSSLHHLLNQYITKQINVKVKFEALLKVVGDFTGYKTGLTC